MSVQREPADGHRGDHEPDEARGLALVRERSRPPPPPARAFAIVDLLRRAAQRVVHRTAAASAVAAAVAVRNWNAVHTAVHTGLQREVLVRPAAAVLRAHVLDDVPVRGRRDARRDGRRGGRTRGGGHAGALEARTARPGPGARAGHSARDARPGSHERVGHFTRADLHRIHVEHREVQRSENAAGVRL